MANGTSDTERADVTAIAEATGAEHIVAWAERELGPVVALERLPRWRASWNLDIARDATTLPVYARGEREADFPAPFSLEHEMAVHALLEEAGLPVPHVYGLVEGPIRTLVMDRVPGVQGLALAADDATRRRLLLDYADLLHTTHRIPLERCRAHGLAVPTGSEVALSEVFRRAERSYLAQAQPPDPALEFLRTWVWRNQPAHRSRPALVAYDSAQFLHDAGRLTALIDFELAHVADPYMDLAALRARDTMEPLGDLGPLFERYAELDGQEIDLEALRYFEVSYTTVTPLLQHPVLRDPAPDTDYVSHLVWYVDNVRYALDILAELHGVELDPLPLVDPRPSAHVAAHRHLVASLRVGARHESTRDLERYGVTGAAAVADGASAPVALPADSEDGSGGFGGWRQRCAYRLARHLARVDEIGAAVAAADTEEAAALLGISASRALADPPDVERRLCAFIERAGPEHDRDLLALFDRRFQRLHQTLGPPGSLIVRHPPLQPLPGSSPR